MPYGLYISGEGAQVQSKRLEVLANNLANAETVGFKKQLAIAQARFAESTQRGYDYHGSGSINDIGGGVAVRETKTDFSPGTLKRTENPAHVAIQGDGFFQVLRDNEVLLTRAGNFALDPTGRLVSQQGYSVLSQDGAPIFVTGPFSVNSSGAIEQDGETVAQLGLVQAASREQLVPVGENLFQPATPDSVAPVPELDRQVASGYLEMSGVSPVTELMELIETTRAYEANVRLMQHQDQMIGNLLNRVLRTT